MAFRFRLAPLLRHRQRAEERRALVLAQAEVRRQAAARRAAMLSAEAEGARGILAGALLRGVTGAELQGLVVATDVLARRTARARATLRDAEAQVAEAREGVVDAARDRRVIERLEARQRQAYQAGVDHAVRRELDEVGATGVLRARASRP